MNLKELTLKQLSQKRKETAEFANQDISNWDRRTYPAAEGRKRKKRQELEQIDDVMVDKILSNSVSVLLMRDVGASDEIVSLAKRKDASVLVIDELQLEKELVEKVYQHLKIDKGYSFNTEVLNKLNILSIDYGDKILATSLPTIKASSAYYGVSRNKEEIVAKFEKVLYNTYNTELKSHLYKINMRNEVKKVLDKTDKLLIFFTNTSDQYLSVFGSFSGKSLIVTKNPNMKGAIFLRDENTPEEFVNILMQVDNLKN